MVCAKHSWTGQGSVWKTSRKGRVAPGDGRAVSRLSEAPNEAEACLRHPESSFAPEQAVKLAEEFTETFMSSPCDLVLGAKSPPLDSHPRNLNIGSRAGAEVGDGDLQEGLEGFGPALSGERSRDVTAPGPTFLGQAATAGGRFRHKGKLLPTEASGAGGWFGWGMCHPTGLGGP